MRGKKAHSHENFEVKYVPKLWKGTGGWSCIKGGLPDYIWEQLVSAPNLFIFFKPESRVWVMYSEMVWNTPHNMGKKTKTNENHVNAVRVDTKWHEPWMESIHAALPCLGVTWPVNHKWNERFFQKMPSNGLLTFWQRKLLWRLTLAVELVHALLCMGSVTVCLLKEKNYFLHLGSQIYMPPLSNVVTLT